MSLRKVVLDLSPKGQVRWSSQHNIDTLTKLAKEEGATFASVSEKIGIKESALRYGSYGKGLGVLDSLYVSASVSPLAIARLVDSGMSITQAAKSVGCHRGTAIRHLESLGRLREFSKSRLSVIERRGKVKEMILDGYTGPVIAKTLGVTEYNVAYDRNTLGLRQSRA